jgi:hypothetical protein
MKTTTKTEFPRALHVKALEPCRLRIRWNTGETLDVDLADKLKGRLLARLRQPDLFAKAHAACTGACIEWEDSEFGADNVYAWTREQMGEASHEMFFAWMHRNNLTLDSAAQALGMSRRMIAYYRNGRKPIPQYVWLACIGWEGLHEKQAA